MKENTQYKKATFQEIISSNVIRCLLCPHFCILSDGKTGLCKTRKNIGSEITSLSYGNPCSVSIDPIEKKPLYHFFPGTEILSIATAGCNFHCLNCQNYTISQTSPKEIQHYNLSPANIIEQAFTHHQKSIAFTYTEPTVFYEYMLDTAGIAKSKGLKTVLVSNGYINPEPLDELTNYLDAANIDLKSIDNQVYKKLTGGKLQPVLDTILKLKEKNVWLEITHLMIPGYTDNPNDFKQRCNWITINGLTNTPLHISRFFPQYKLNQLSPTPIETLLLAEKIAREAGIKYVYIGNVSKTKSENTYCPVCGKLLIERSGYKIIGNNIYKNACPHCGAKIAGVWE